MLVFDTNKTNGKGKGNFGMRIRSLPRLGKYCNEKPTSTYLKQFHPYVGLHKLYLLLVIICPQEQVFFCIHFAHLDHSIKNLSQRPCVKNELALNKK